MSFLKAPNIDVCYVKVFAISIALFTKAKMFVFPRTNVGISKKSRFKIEYFCNVLLFRSDCRFNIR